MTTDVLLRRFLASGMPTSAVSPWQPADAEAAVGWLGGVQAQDFEMTLWSLGRRCGRSRDEVLGAYEQGAIVRAHALRQTWHLLRAQDYAWIQAAIGPRVQQLNARQYPLLDLDATLLRRTDDLISIAVSERALTRAEIADMLAAHGIAATGLRLGVIVMNAELAGLVASGPMRGRQHTYAPAPRFPGPAGEEALVELGRRFLQSHGPASVADFATWASLTRTEARAAIAGLGGDVSSERREGFTVFTLAAEPRALPDWRTPQVDLLNGYDEYLMGGLETKRLLSDKSVFRLQRGMPVATVAGAGRLAGHWRRRISGARVEVEVLTLRDFSAAEVAATEQQAAALGAFLDRRWTLAMGPLA